jgi:hypothetical protein
MAHCHIAEHMQSGMMFSFTVAPPGSAPVTVRQSGSIQAAGPGGGQNPQE